MSTPLFENDEFVRAEIQEQIRRAEEQILQESKRIEFYLTDYSVELLANKMGSEELWIPPYQREDTWEPERKSRFIESLVMGLAIPFLFFWEREDGKLEIVDGSQRLRTIKQFLDSELTIGSLDVLTELEGLRFSDLPEGRQRKIKNRSIRGIVLNEHADEQARFDIFERINTGSKIANKAEVRRGALVGPFLALVIELAKDSLFEHLAPVSDKEVKTREREELVTRFFAYGDGLSGYRDRPSDFLFQYSRMMNERMSADQSLDEQYRARFSLVMKFIERNFPMGFRRTPRGTETPRNRFEAIAIGSLRAIETIPAVADCSIEVTQWLDGPEFKRLTKSGGSNAVRSLTDRIEYVKTQILESYGGH